MVHLCVHLPDQVLLGGPVAPRWMFGTERHMGLYKRYVKNMARPDGSIVEAFVVDEAVSFLSRYVSNIETRFNRLERNWDLPLPNHHMDIFKSNVRPLGAASIKLLQNWKNIIQWYILNNSADDIQEYLDEHKKLLQERGISYSDIDVKQREEFPSWFRIKISQMQVQNSAIINDDLYSLSQGPLERYHSYQSCVVNGVRFRCKEYDDTLKTQFSGVCTEGDHENENLIYYGVLIEILELSFLLDRKVFLFRCKWYNSSLKCRTIYVDNNLTSINTSTDWYTNEPFILSTQAQQVFYLLDMKRGSSWRFVQKVNHRSMYDIPETSEVVNDLSNNDIFQEEESVHLPSFQPVEDSIESSSLVRQDVTSLSLSDKLIADLFSKNEYQSSRDDDELDGTEENEIYDDGNIFFDDELIFSSDNED
ncbi:uncharacterized protein LOC141705882 [Apium graveolens]|uniref:uncharacterized protein LOC141705882 n=1 Tax=Apium graveolens TaxID=4045 RepID=UPI003D7B463E